MKIYFIRHAESVNNHLWHQYRDNTDRQDDPPLSELGFRQAQALGEFLADRKEEFNFTRILISPFLRTLQTAAAFEQLYDVPKIVWKPIHEEGGCVATDPVTRADTGAPGKTRAEIQALFPQYSVSDEIGEEGWWNRPIVEPQHERIARAQQVIQTLAQQFGGSRERIALVSHGGFHAKWIDVLINNIRHYNYWFETENTSVSCYSIGPERGEGFETDQWRIEYLNRCEWLTDLRRDW